MPKPPITLHELALLRDRIADDQDRRDAWVIELHRQGVNREAIAEAAGMSRMTVHRTVTRAAA